MGYLETIRVFDISELESLKINPVSIKKYWNKNGNRFQKMQFFDLMTLMPEDFFYESR